MNRLPSKKTLPSKDAWRKLHGCPSFGIDCLSNAQRRPSLRIASPTVRAVFGDRGWRVAEILLDLANFGCHLCAEFSHYLYGRSS